MGQQVELRSIKAGGKFRLIDVLAVLDAEIDAAMSACESVHGSPRLTSLVEARAAVAGLVKAATNAARVLPDGALYAIELRAALARVGGAA